jgi:hypothetical protein
MKRSLGLVFVISIGVTACGGGSDDGNSQSFVPANDISITGSNGQEVARVTYLAAAQSGDSAGLLGNAPITAGPSSVNKVSKEFSTPMEVVASQIPYGPEIVPCDMKGSVEISGNIRNPLTLSPDDTISVKAVDCDDGLGEIIDGTIHFTVRAISGDINAGLYELTMVMEVIDFQVTTPDDVLLTNGDVTVMVDTRQSPYVVTTVGGNSLTLDRNDGFETLVGYSISGIFDGGLVPSPYTMTASGTLDNSVLGGTVHYSTPRTFEGLDLDYPHKGELLIRGQNNTSVRLIALENGIVHILIHSSGNSEPDEIIETTWDALLG